MDTNFLLLQINDVAFPVGAYSHSGGLETYVQKDCLNEIENIRLYLHNRLRYGLLYNELLALKLSYQYAKNQDIDALKHLETVYKASRIPKELREAGEKMGNRFVKTLQRLPVEYTDTIFNRYLNERTSAPLTYPIAYGIFCYTAGIAYSDCVEFFLYAQTSSLITNCVKSIPLSQTEGQKLLIECQKIYTEVLEELENLTEEDLGLSMPGFDISSMEHENLYSRLYMS